MRTLLMILTVLFSATSVLAQKRVALVLGNSAYAHTPQLTNPGNDANDLADVLMKLGFEVIQGRDLDKAGMEGAIRRFADALSDAQMGLFYYAGHGLQVNGQNYLVPIDAQLNSNSALDFEMIRLDVVQRSMERSTATNIIILDACRDNPLARNLARTLGTRSSSIGRGLAAMESGEGTLISFSTQPGNVALDGVGRNSPFAAALVRHLATPGEDLPTILISVRNDVMMATDRRQVPWEHSALTAKIYFTPPKPTGATHEQYVELTFWNAVKDSRNATVLRTYLDRYPKGEFAPVAARLIEQYELKAKAALTNSDAEKRRDELPKSGDTRKSGATTKDVPQGKERRIGGADSAQAAGRKYWPGNTIQPGQSMSVTTSDGRRLTCIGGDYRAGKARQCRWN